MNTVATLRIEKEKTFDTVVIGGGVAGCAAVIAAARHGAQTLLVEEFGVLGGQAVMGLVTPLDARFSRSGKSFGGILEEVSEKTAALSGAYCLRGAEGTANSIAAPHILKYVLLETCEKAGVQLMLHTSLIACETEHDTIQAVLVSTESGLIRIHAAVFIDATGDADLAVQSGAAVVKGSEPGCFRALTESGLNHSHYRTDLAYDAYEQNGLMQPVSIFILMGASAMTTISSMG